MPNRMATDLAEHAGHSFNTPRNQRMAMLTGFRSRP